MLFFNPVRMCQAFQRVRVHSEVLNACYLSSKSVNISLPTKPRKPAGAYIRFTQSVIPSLKLKDSNMSYKDALSKAAAMWNTADEVTKAPFLKAYNEDYVQYLKLMESYRASLSEEQKCAIKQQETDVKNRKEKFKMKKVMKKLGKPKKPLSGYSLYVSVMGKQKPEGKTPSEWMKEISQNWKLLSNEEKEQYLLQSKKLREEYEVKLQKWTEEVLNNPNRDLSETEILDKSEKVGDYSTTDNVNKINGVSNFETSISEVERCTQEFNEAPVFRDIKHRVSSFIFNFMKNLKK